MSEAVVHLSFPAKPDYLLLARLALAGVARGLPVGPELLADLKLAVTEACGNAVRHAYDADGGPVELAFVLGDDRLEMIAAVMGPPQDLTDGGMGMAIIRAIVDELDIRAGKDGRGTVVHMTKYLDAAA
jgi:serine/threonine-protein kinase RsbW